MVQTFLLTKFVQLALCEPKNKNCSNTKFSTFASPAPLPSKRINDLCLGFYDGSINEDAFRGLNFQEKYYYYSAGNCVLLYHGKQ